MESRAFKALWRRDMWPGFAHLQTLPLSTVIIQTAFLLSSYEAL